MSSDPHDRWNLARFVSAQDRDGTYERAFAELQAGHKRSHWMWFVFPQLAGLGRSATSQHFAISSLDEARAYLAHPTLGPRLVDCASVVADATGTAEQVLGGIDAMKLHSSATLFHRAAPGEPAFRAVLDRHFDGSVDRATEQLLDGRR